MKKVLVITCKDDLHCDFVTKKIREAGSDIIRINSDNYSSNISFNITNINEFSFDFEFKISDAELSFSSHSYDSIWYRKPFAIDVTDQYQNLTISKFINSEFEFFINEFYALNDTKNWINPLIANKNASYKLSNLNLANKLGLKIPRTIVTNNPIVAGEFAQKCNWNILSKPFQTKAFRHEGQTYYSFASKINKVDFINSQDAIRFCPTLLQEYIDKKLELRVTVVGTDIFTVAIHSQENDLTKHDFRADNAFNIKHSVFDLPKYVKEKILQFNRIRKLSFSTFDIILTPEMEYVFLECNPNGQWYWIEEISGLPISTALAKLLLK